MMVTTYDSYAEAAEQIPDNKEMSVSCTFMPDGKPVYFLVPEGDRKQEIAREMSFMILRGRQLSGYEKWLLQAAEEQLAGERAPGFEVVGADAD